MSLILDLQEVTAFAHALFRKAFGYHLVVFDMVYLLVGWATIACNSMTVLYK